jgi:hypothetical protein
VQYAPGMQYAWGIRVTERHGQLMHSHGGSWPGWVAKTIRLPDAGISLAALSNSAQTERMHQLSLQSSTAARTGATSPEVSITTPPRPSDWASASDKIASQLRGGIPDFSTSLTQRFSGR